MRFDDPFDPARRRLLGAGGALALALAARPWRAFGQESGGSKPPIGIIGSGHMGSTVGGLWARAGYRVMFSSRHPAYLRSVAGGYGPLAEYGPVADAIAMGDVIFLAVPYGAMPEIGQDYGAALKGKIVLDAGNAVPDRDGAIVDEVERDGIGITSQRYLPGTRLVRAFNTLSYTILASQAHRPDPLLAIPIAGDDPEALQVAERLVRDAGFDPVVVGGLADARLFQLGGPGYGQAVPAAELRRILASDQ